VDVVKQDHELFQDIKVSTSVDLSNVEEVVVLLAGQEAG